MTADVGLWKVTASPVFLKKALGIHEGKIGREKLKHWIVLLSCYFNKLNDERQYILLIPFMACLVTLVLSKEGKGRGRKLTFD